MHTLDQLQTIYPNLYFQCFAAFSESPAHSSFIHGLIGGFLYHLQIQRFLLISSALEPIMKCFCFAQIPPKE
jgi:hypothetical protein